MCPRLIACSAHLKEMMAGPHLCSRRWVWEQYDHMVMADTVQRPGGDAAVIRVGGPGSRKGLALACDVTPRYCAADPETGGAQAVAETWRNLTAVGATPLAITNCLNFGNPERPEIMGEIAGCVTGMGEGGARAQLPGRVGQRVALQRDEWRRDPADSGDRRRWAAAGSGAHGDNRLQAG